MSGKKYATSAPLLGEIRETGSTFYTISTALNDIDKTQMNSNIMMAPSRFVCLNLPDWANHQTYQHFFIEPNSIGTPIQTDANVIVPKLIQNYIENGIAVTNTERLDDSLQTIAESMFWKLMKKTGAFRVHEASSNYIKNGTEYKIWEEQEQITQQEENRYKSLVVYASDINVINHIQKSGQSYTEVYMHVPTDATKSKPVKLIQNKIELTNTFIGGPEKTVGLEDHSNNTHAIYDNDLNQYTFNPEDLTGIWWDDIDANKIEKIVNADFEFNVVLVYYDIWYKDKPSTKKTNLYGILFLNRFSNENGYGTQRIETANKNTPNRINTGNGYAIRLNIKTTSNQSQVTSEVSINDYNSVSMELYMTALKRLNEVTDLYDTAIKNLNSINTRLEKIELLIPRIVNAAEQ